MRFNRARSTSWREVGGWYNKIVGKSGHFYHQAVILPNGLRLLDLRKGERLLDIGCGQGVLARVIPKEVEYLGIDSAENLVTEAKRLDKNPRHSYVVADATLPRKLAEVDKMAIILALQNIRDTASLFKNCRGWLKKNGKMLLVINHPCFRIPKHSDWTVVRERQWRMVDSYMSSWEIPIESSPFDKKENQISWSYHHPLAYYSQELAENGLLIEKIEEWVSPKKSTGAMAKIEDKAREEIPLFMAIVVKKP